MAQVKPVNKKKMSGPKLAAMIVSIAILIGLVVSLLAGSGLFVRAQKGASSENFKVNGAMMEYYTMSYYQNWYSQYYYYILLGYVQFNPNAPLDEQYTDSSKTETYYDMFKEGAISNVTRILKYCEAARVDEKFDFAKIEAEAETYAKDTIKSLKESAKTNGTDFNTFLRQNFGQHINTNDLTKSIVLEYIASKYSESMYDRIFEDMKDERINEYFGDNLKSFITAEYLTFSLSQKHTPESVDEKAYPGGKEDPDYKAAVEKAKEEAKKKNELQKVADKEFIDKLATAKTAEEFKRMLLEYQFSDIFDSTYQTAVKNFATPDKPSADELKAYKEELTAKMKDFIDAVIEGKDDITADEDEPETVDEETLTKWEKAKATFTKSMVTNLKKVITNATKTVAYDVSNDVGKFLFAGVKAQFGIEYDKDEEKGESASVNENFYEEKEFSESEKEAAEAEGKYTLSIYFVTEAAHRDETILRNVGHILFQVDEKGQTEGAFKTWDEAKTEAEKVLAEIKATEKNGVVEKDVFETFGKEHTNDSNVFYEDVNKGDMVEEFEDWLFAATKVGEVGLVKTADYGYHIMFYNGETEPAWKFDAHEGATNADLEEWYKGLSHEVEINEDIFKTILG